MHWRSNIFHNELFPTTLVLVRASCKNTTNISEQLIYSPNYPSNYNDNEYCKWELTAPCGRHIMLELFEFRTEVLYDEFNVYNNIEKKEGTKGALNFPQITTDYGSIIKKGKGHVLKHWISDWHMMGLEFNTDCIVNYSGFLLRYTLLGIGTFL